MRKLLLACVSAVSLMGVAACDGSTEPPTGTPVDLSFAPCAGGNQAPSWFAFQDGDGSWKQVTENSSGAFNFSIASGRGGLAHYDPANGLVVMYATTDELKASMPACNGGLVRTVSGQVTGYTSADNIFLIAGQSSAKIFANTVPAPASFSLADVDPIVSDLVGVRYRLTGGTPGTAFERRPSNIFVRRGVTGTSTGLVDFSSTTEAGAPAAGTVGVTNLSAGEELSVLSYLALPTTMANIAEYDAPAALVTGSTTATFYGLPLARLDPSDRHMLSVNAHATASSSSQTNRFATILFRDPGAQSITLGPLLGSVTVSGTSRPTATYTVQAAYNGLFDVLFSQGNSSSFRQVEVAATRAYLGTGTTVTLTVPNLAGTPGFSSSWLLNTGVSSTWSFLATDAGLAVLGVGPLTYQGAERSTDFTP
jgi:hypothetical protein